MTSPAKIMVQQLSTERLMRKIGTDFDWLATFHFYSTMQTEFHNLWLAREGTGREGRVLLCCQFYHFTVTYIWFSWYLKGPKYLMRFHLQNDKITIQFYKKWEKPRKLPHFVELLEIENIGEHQLFGLGAGRCLEVENKRLLVLLMLI